MALKPNPLRPNATPAEIAAHRAAEQHQRQFPELWGNGPEHARGPAHEAAQTAVRPAPAAHVAPLADLPTQLTRTKSK